MPLCQLKMLRTKPKSIYMIATRQRWPGLHTYCFWRASWLSGCGREYAHQNVCCQAEMQQNGQTLKHKDPQLKLDTDSMITFNYTCDWGWDMKTQLNHINVGKKQTNTWDLKGYRSRLGIATSRLSATLRIFFVPQILLPKSHQWSHLFTGNRREQSNWNKELHFPLHQPQ